jgi:hypothetical protein
LVEVRLDFLEDLLSEYLRRRFTQSLNTFLCQNPLYGITQV